MIVFDLKCTCGCQFEGWFESRADFEKQNGNGQIACPQCGSDEIHKILSPVAIHSRTAQSEASAPPTDDFDINLDMAFKFFRSVQDFVEKNFEDVGSKLAEESLKVHYGVTEPRRIRGVATAAEEKMLLDEGIELLKIPMIKKSSDRKLN